MIETKGFELAITNATEPYGAISNIIKYIKELLSLEDICSHKDEILALANSAIDKAIALVDVAVDVPYIPDALEKAAWELVAKAAKMQVQALVLKVCP